MRMKNINKTITYRGPSKPYTYTAIDIVDPNKRQDTSEVRSWYIAQPAIEVLCSSAVKLRTVKLDNTRFVFS